MHVWWGERIYGKIYLCQGAKPNLESGLANTQCGVWSGEATGVGTALFISLLFEIVGGFVCID